MTRPPLARLLCNIYEAARAGIPVYARLLGDPAEEVRMYAAFALGWFKDDVAEAALREHLDVEENERARASAVWSLSMVAAPRGGAFQVERWFAESEPRLVRLVLEAIVRSDGAFSYANIARSLWERGLPGERAGLAAFLNQA